MLSVLCSPATRFSLHSVVHSNSHNGTWDPKVLGGGASNSSYARLNCGHEEGLLHARTLAPFTRAKEDKRNNIRWGFEIVRSRELDNVSVEGGSRATEEKRGGKESLCQC